MHSADGPLLFSHMPLRGTNNQQKCLLQRAAEMEDIYEGI